MTDTYSVAYDQPTNAPALQKTYTGVYFDYLDPKAEMIRPFDIAHQLSLINRFCGATPQPYSVGEHCIVVANMLWHRYGDPELALAGLLHDATEAYVNDINGMMKKLPLLEGFRTIEHGISTLMEIRFGLPPGSLERPAVKQADKDAFEFECAFVRDNRARRASKSRAVEREYLRLLWQWAPDAMDAIEMELAWHA